MSVLKLILLSVRRNRACATVDTCIYANHSFRERERERERERDESFNLSKIYVGEKMPPIMANFKDG